MLTFTCVMRTCRMGGIMVQVVFFWCGVKSEERQLAQLPTALLEASTGFILFQAFHFQIFHRGPWAVRDGCHFPRRQKTYLLYKIDLQFLQSVAMIKSTHLLSPQDIETNNSRSWCSLRCCCFFKIIRM